MSPRIKKKSHLDREDEMTTLRRISQFGLTAALAVTLHSGGVIAQNRTGVTDTTIKIGMFGPLTGAVSMWGYPINNGAIALYNQINETGGINGRKIEIIHEDGACDPAKTVAAVKKLIHRDQVFMIHGGTCSAAVFAAKDEIVSNKVPFVVMTATMDRIVAPANDYVFATSLPGSADGKLMGDFVISQNAKRVVIVKHADEWADTKAKGFVDMAGGKFEIVATEQLDKKVSDATAQVLKVQQHNADMTAIFAYPAEMAVFLRDAHKYGLKGPFVTTTSGMDLHDLAKRAGSAEAVANLNSISFLANPPGSPEIKEFEDTYRKYFPSDRIQSVTFFGMSGTLLVIDALKRAGRDLTRERFLETVSATRGLPAGPAACNITFSPQSHQGCVTGAIWRLENGAIKSSLLK